MIDLFLVICLVISVIISSLLYGKYVEEKRVNKHLKETIDQSNNWVKDTKDDIRDIKQFTTRLDASPQFRGTIGEEIVSTMLSYLPGDAIEEQVSDPKIPGRPDFAVNLPTTDLRLIIDSKWIDEPDSKLGKILKRKALDIAKYIVPGHTFPFVIMWVPEHAYYEMSREDYIEFFEKNIIPTTTTNLMAVIHLINHAYKIFDLNERASEFMDFKTNMKSSVNLALKEFSKAYKQTSHAVSNLEAVESILKNLQRSIEDE